VLPTLYLLFEKDAPLSSDLDKVEEQKAGPVAL
jgi:hypothetical protein